MKLIHPNWTLASLAHQGLEHAYVRKHGYEKGLALTEAVSVQAFSEIMDASRLDNNNNGTTTTMTTTTAEGEFSASTVAAIPFFSGGAVVNVTHDSSGHEHLVHVGTAGSGGANTHTLAPAQLKYYQLAAVVASVAEYIRFVVIGVVDEAEAAATRSYLRRSLPAALTAPHRLRVVNVQSAGFGAYLPYRLLRWMQKTNAAGKGAFYSSGSSSGGESGSDGSGGDEKHDHSKHHHNHHRSHHHSHKHKHHRANDNGSHDNHNDNNTTMTTESNSSSYPAEQRRSSSSSSSSQHHQIGPFEFIYYTEADNILRLGTPPGIVQGEAFPAKPTTRATSATTAVPEAEQTPQERRAQRRRQEAEKTNVNVIPSREEVLAASHERRGVVAAALMAFLRSPNGAVSFVAPQRLENRGRVPPKRGSVLMGCEPVGQNKCQDERGERAVFSGRRAGSTIVLRRTNIAGRG